jgi:hypothetical protein
MRHGVDSHLLRYASLSSAGCPDDLMAEGAPPRGRISQTAFTVSAPVYLPEDGL